MPTPHINAPDGAFAKTVLMPGDPLRARVMAEKFLDDPKLVTDVRNVFGYTGNYKGRPVSIMASGMGMPSIGIYSFELYTYYGVENIIRIGSAGSYTTDLNVLDVVLASAAYSESSYARVRDGITDTTLYPSSSLNEAIMATARDLGMECHLTKILSSDVFYGGAGGSKWPELAAKEGVTCVEMESFALFHNANMLGKNAACLLTISDSLVSHEELSAEDRQNSFLSMMKLALEAAVSLE